MKKQTILLIILLPLTLISQQTTEIFRYPSLSPDGTQIALSYQGDIWTVPSDGGKAIRLTIHEAYESDPQWSPDGKTILFSSQRNGNNDLYTIKADGQDLMRLTYHSSADVDGAWKSNNEIIFSSRKNFVAIEREAEFHKIPATGGTPERMLNSLGSDANFTAESQLMAYVRGGCRIAREAYRGPANRDIWIYNESNKTYHQVSNDEGQDIMPQWADKSTLYFLSARTGKYNIYRTDINADGSKSGDLTSVTSFSDEGIRNYDVSADGKFIVFVHGVDVMLHNVATKENKKVEIQVTKDYRFDPISHENLTSGVGDYSISPDEKYIAFTIKGDLFFKQNDKEKKLTINPLSQSSRETQVQWLNNQTALFLSDRNGNYDLFSISSADSNEDNIFKSFRWNINAVHTSSAEDLEFTLSPDKTQIAILQEPGKLIIADIDSSAKISNEKILLDGWASPGGIDWSPDSKWIAYALEDLNFNEEIFIHKADGSLDPVNVSMHPRGDRSPKWSMDGSKLGFLSIRNNGDSDVWFAWLNKKDWEKTNRDWEELTDEEPEKGKEDKDKKAKEDKVVNEVIIDLENIHERLQQVTSMAGNEGDLAIDGEGEIFLFSTNNGGRQGSGGEQEYKKVKWNGEDMKNLMSGGSVGNIQLDKKGKNLYYTKSGKLNIVGIESGKSTALPFSARMDINEAEYRSQVFDEAWRTINDRFYDPQFHGQDWKALGEKYKPRAMAASTHSDFQMLFNEMLGQVNASHMGLRGSGPEETQRERTGLLGIEVTNNSGGVEVTSIVPDSPADREESKLNVGDVITAVNGKQINEGVNFYSLMNGNANERILLEVSSNGVSRDVIIRPSTSVNTEKYEAWIQERKDLTDKYSNGKLGYIHIRGMNWPSFERFERELMASGYGKEGIVIDVRYNGGGWTTDMVMAVLNVRQHSYTVPRGATDDLAKNNKSFKENYPFGERLPLSALTKPSIALCNESSYSNAEIFSHAFKTLGHGKLVGKPTFGAVISTGGRGLMDGSFVRVPFRAWYVKATEENMEWGPAVPDYIVENSPEARSNNEDEQLKKAVEVLLGDM